MLLKMDLSGSRRAEKTIESIEFTFISISSSFSHRTSDHDVTDSVTVAASTMTSGDIKPTSPLKSSSQRRPKIKKNASTCTTTSEVGTITNPTSGPSTLSVVEIESDPKKSTGTGGPTKTTSTPTLSSSPEKQDMHIVNERHNGSMYQKHSAGTVDDEDEDSENEKLSPLLSPGSRSKNTSSKSLKQVVASLGGGGDGGDDNDNDDVDTDREHSDAVTTPGTVGSTGTGDGGIIVGDAALSETSSRKSGSLKRTKHRPELSDGGAPASDTGSLAANLSAEESDYYTPEDTQNTILSPLCQAERTKSGDPLCSGCGVANRSASRELSVPSAVTVAFSGGSVAKKNQNLHKKSTSVGNIVGPGGTVTTCSGVDLKMNNVSSLPGECSCSWPETYYRMG